MIGKFLVIFPRIIESRFSSIATSHRFIRITWGVRKCPGRALDHLQSERGTPLNLCKNLRYYLSVHERYDGHLRDDLKHEQERIHDNRCSAPSRSSRHVSGRAQFSAQTAKPVQPNGGAVRDGGRIRISAAGFALSYRSNTGLVKREIQESSQRVRPHSGRGCWRCESLLFRL